VPGALPGFEKIIPVPGDKQNRAEIIAACLDLAIEIRPVMRENDRAATGFLPPAEFEVTADAFFARPRESVRG
jgi:hypothetical protein